MTENLLPAVCIALSLPLLACGDDSHSDPPVEGTSAAPGTSTGAESTGVASTTADEASTGGSTGTPATSGSDTAGESETTAGIDPPAPVALHTIIYEPGPAWDPKLPPREQNLGDHFAYIQSLFDAGSLVANGPFLDDGRGFYLHLAEQTDDIDAVIDDDPAVQSGVLQLDELGGWTLLVSNLGADVGDDALFVLNYNPGPQWVDGVPLARQDTIGEHLAYVGDAFESGDLLAGGPVDDTAGRYIVALPDAATAEDWVDADPTVANGLFVVETKPWLALLRQAAVTP